MLKRLIWNFIHGIRKSKTKVPLDDCVKQFNGNNWSKLNTIQKMHLLEQTMNSYCDNQGIKNLPRLFYKEENGLKNGQYNQTFNAITVNMTKLDNPYKALDTIIHESNHAYQRACVKDKLNTPTKYSDVDLDSIKNDYGFIATDNSFTERDSFFTAAKFVISNGNISKSDPYYKNYIDGRLRRFEELSDKYSDRNHMIKILKDEWLKINERKE